MWWIIWLVIGIACVIFEAATPQLTSVWFALGAVAALIVSFFTPDNLWWIQLVVFIIVSAVAVALTRPIARKLLEKNKSRVNADRFLGAEGVVIESIDNVLGKGQVKSMGTVWSARTEDDEERLQTGTVVTIKRIEGVKVIVEVKK